ncbi:AraC family ligand binding domain-containing protein [Geomicrobium sp. JCM 19055]|uniref:AraC family ligand binding domain-containing protein n=1 Tax=Geomicrobium sp. JCM 19055 TaxID=1460649 RepID=UPI00045ECC7F|nr:AraC family ligand binding domain-containing protein [Geomicrobium sp. JCM 19055]GAK00668.1 transcriptional regulator, AraC family [Geomicrobium sp. JCM 19055]
MNTFNYKNSYGLTALSATLADFSYSKHSHNDYALGVTKRGIQHYELDGELQLSHPGGVMQFNPEQVHDGRAHDKNGLEYIMVYISPKMLTEAIGVNDGFKFTEPVIYDKVIQSLITQLTYGIFHQHSEIRCLELLTELASQLNPMKSKIIGKQDSLIQEIKESLHEKVKEALVIDELSKEYGMSKFQFIRFFKEQTKTTPYQYFFESETRRNQKNNLRMKVMYTQSSLITILLI